MAVSGNKCLAYIDGIKLNTERESVITNGIVVEVDYVYDSKESKYSDYLKYLDNYYLVEVKADSEIFYNHKSVCKKVQLISTYKEAVFVRLTFIRKGYEGINLE